MAKRINVTKSFLPAYDEYCAEIKGLWDTHWITNMGSKHQELQDKLRLKLKVRNVLLYTNGHLALENILEAYNFPSGSEIITTPFTFASTTHAIVRKGLIPIFCDINKNSYTIDHEKIESLITKKTKAIMPVHVYGNMCDVEAIESIARRHNLKVIYDAAHAFGVNYKGVSSASYGDVSMFSFHATKVFHTIEGGALCFSDDNLLPTLSEYRDFGIRSEEDVAYIGGNAKMNEFQASMGLCNLRHIDEQILLRKKIVDHYNLRLSNIHGIKLNTLQPDVESNYAYYPVVFDNYKYSRDEVIDKLKENNIYARKYFYPITNSFSCYSNLSTAGIDKTPIAFEISKKVLTLPLYADLAISDVDYICDIILS